MFFIVRNNTIGSSVIEVLISCLILSLLLGTLCKVFEAGSSGWLKARNSVEVEESVQVVIIRIQQDIRQSSKSSISIAKNIYDNDTISFISPYNDLGHVSFDSITCKNDWKKYIIYYLASDSANSSDDFQGFKILRKELTGDFSIPFRIEEVYDNQRPTYYINNPHANLIPPYPAEGRTISRNIVKLEFQLYTNLLNIKVQALKKGDKNLMEQNVSVTFRN